MPGRFTCLGWSRTNCGRSDAASLVGRAVVLDPGFAEAHNDKGVILAANGLISDALACFETAVALAPGYVEARNNLGRGLLSLGRFDEAVTQFELVLKNTSNSALAHFNLASVLELAGQHSAAEQHYRSAIAHAPRLCRCAAPSRVLAAEDGSPGRSPRPCGNAVGCDQTVPAPAKISVISCAAWAGATTRSLQYQSALRIDPKLFMAHYNCGVALRGGTRIAEARANFARALALKPDFLEAEFAFAWRSFRLSTRLPPTSPCGALPIRAGWRN